MQVLDNGRQPLMNVVTHCSLSGRLHIVHIAPSQAPVVQCGVFAAAGAELGRQRAGSAAVVCQDQQPSAADVLCKPSRALISGC